jgi:hypothetical protein
MNFLNPCSQRALNPCLVLAFEGEDDKSADNSVILPLVAVTIPVHDAHYRATKVLQNEVLVIISKYRRE